ncbi:hypothetical protein K443DRAFT_13664 [Laccaria amethystina LaAM-08-1]|uniref:Uncharacterized protein n=1 Tax=Laccaria amethystina LaAM-08-1 TaxID=1095629 RepID=A0A0C9WUU9_9AGAR|nr:hypothetical protein K443DRAFT_13664 [Laccaria amethystina LaAM-08-1]
MTIHIPTSRNRPSVLLSGNLQPDFAKPQPRESTVLWRLEKTTDLEKHQKKDLEDKKKSDGDFQYCVPDLEARIL